MRYAHLFESIYLRPWFITPSAHHTIRALFERHLVTGLGRAASPLAADTELDFSAFVNARRPLAIDDDGIATIHVLGPIGKNLSQIEQSCGATGIEAVRTDYAAAIAGGARGILLHFDSPGGTITGVPELARMIAGKALPTVAYTEDLMASAAYYLASGADAIVATPSAEVGSIGVYIPWVDSSVAIAAAGLKPDPIVNTGGDLKALGFGGSLTAEQRAYLQEQVDADFAAFQQHILTYRAVPAEAMRGQTLSGHAALASGLIDYLGDLATAKDTLRQLIPA